jgi:hypothetical protein
MEWLELDLISISTERDQAALICAEHNHVMLCEAFQDFGTWMMELILIAV